MIKILNASQIREADQYTISHEPVSSIDLMERASRAFTCWFTGQFTPSEKLIVICGKGNNGGDGLAIARMLHQEGFDPEVFIINHSEKASPDFAVNLQRLGEQHSFRYINSISDFPAAIPEQTLLIDAIFGSGLSRPVEGLVKQVCDRINEQKLRVVSVDIPSGLFMDEPNSPSDSIIKAAFTISFELPKLAFFLPQNEAFVGDWKAVKIGLSEAFIQKTETKFYYTGSIGHLLKPRNKFSNKGTFGSALLIAGSKGMMGAAVLAAKACMRSGAGKMQVNVPASGNDILQISVPEAMTVRSPGENHLTTHWTSEDTGKFDAVGIGPGLGSHEDLAASMASLFKTCEKPLVIDADGLNVLNSEKGKELKLLSLVPPGTILTPHPKEFQRLMGKSWANDYEKLKYLSDFAIESKLTVCLKGHHTAVALPDGSIHFNSTGNSGMATAGSGDVLTGMVLAFLAQGYPPEDAAIISVFEHGRAGDRAAAQRSERSVIAGDIIENIR